MATIGSAFSLQLSILHDGQRLGESEQQSEPDFIPWKNSNGLERILKTDTSSEVLIDRRCNFEADDE